MEEITYEVADGIATITLNRPDRLNAFTARMAGELVAAFDRSDADDTVRAVIVTGAGRAFSPVPIWRLGQTPSTSPDRGNPRSEPTAPSTIPIPPSAIWAAPCRCGFSAA